jgi:hypothetical protein
MYYADKRIQESGRLGALNSALSSSTPKVGQVKSQGIPTESSRHSSLLLHPSSCSTSSKMKSPVASLSMGK